MTDNKDDDIIVENVESKVPEDDIVVEHVGNPPPKTAKTEISADEGINSLKAKLAESEKARSEADRRARDAAIAAQQAELRAGNSDLHLINSAIHSVRRENDILKANLQTYMANGDHVQAANIQEHLATNAAKLLQLENGKSEMEAAQKNPPKPVTPMLDPVESLASQLSPRSAAWVRRNPQCVTDQRLYQKMIAAHNLAIADGYEPDSDDYFGFVEDTLKLNRRPEVENPLSAAATPTKHRAAPPAAPVSRSGTANGVRTDVVRLTEDEREIARLNKMTDKEYAKMKLALQREGKLN